VLRRIFVPLSKKQRIGKEDNEELYNYILHKISE
jgi:hypothetical protein